MDYTIYEFSLFIALPLMLFFGFYFLLAKIPEKVIFGINLPDSLLHHIFGKVLITA